MNRLLFFIVVLAWGLTWYGIHLQLGAAPDDVSIFWRFLVAAIALWAWLIASGRARRVSMRQHIWFAAMGATLFSANFLSFYACEAYIPSGIAAVVFSMAIAFNALNLFLFRRIRPSARVVVGAVLGTMGVACLFADQILAPAGQSGMARGILLALLGTYLFSLGNLATGQATRTGIDLPNAMARGMGWGAAFLAGIVLLHGHSFMPGTSATYLGALLYLAIIGSVIGFLAYLTLVARIGAERAAYTTVITPIIALSVSAVLEGYGWNPVSLAGLPLILLGNVVIFAPARWIRAFA
jgi:drug/metabolite transporter (DMT)-like permease